MTHPHPLVLIHGWAGSAASWDALLPHLDSSRWDPILPMALPGSPGYVGTSTPTVGAAAREVVGRLRGLSSPAVIVGHSMGAQVSLLAHAAAPDAVCAEVVIAPAYGPTLDERHHFAAWAERIERGGHAELVQFFSEALEGLPPEVAAAAMQDFESTPLDVIVRYLRSEYLDDDAVGLLPHTQRAARLRRHPVLAVHCDATAAATERLLAAPDGSRVECWPAAHHFLHLEFPARFAALLESWARGVAGNQKYQAAIPG